MVRITVDADLPNRLSQLHEPAELFTTEGRRIGRFLPEGPAVMTIPEAREAGLCPFSDAELEEFRSAPGEGRPLADIWKELGR